MKPEQQMGITFTIFGLAMGFLSTFIGASFLSYTAPILIYIGALFAMTKVFKQKKIKWIVINSIVSFLLVWVTSWIFLFNTF